MAAHRAPVALRHVQEIAGYKGTEFPQHERMGKAEQAGEGAAVAGNAETGGHDQTRLDRRQERIVRLKPCNERHKALDLRRLAVHAASRLRNVTMIDLEVGVSLSSPALPSGTSTLSSG